VTAGPPAAVQATYMQWAIFRRITGGVRVNCWCVLQCSAVAASSAAPSVALDERTSFVADRQTDGRGAVATEQWPTCTTLDS